MDAHELLQQIEQIAPLHAAASWDASGVQVASFRKEISHVAVMLDPQLETFQAATEQGADCIVTHHPLAMKPRFPNKADAHFSLLSHCITRDIMLYSAHTSLDANPLGPVLWLAHELALQDVQLLEATASAEPHTQAFFTPETAAAAWGAKTNAQGPSLHAPLQYGFGFCGILPKPVSYDAFCQHFAPIVGQTCWQVSGPQPEYISRVACCPGSGGSLLENVLRAKADIFITGDIKYHSALDAQSAGLRIVDVGHFTLEEEMMRRFAVYLQKKLAITVTFFPNHDPITQECVAGSA